MAINRVIFFCCSQPFIALIDCSSIESNTKEINFQKITIDRGFIFDDHVNDLCKKANGKRP